MTFMFKIEPKRTANTLDQYTQVHMYIHNNIITHYSVAKLAKILQESQIQRKNKILFY
jgi:hypothetical protein